MVPSVIGGLNEELERSDRRESQTGLSGMRSSSVASQGSLASSADQDEINATLRFIRGRALFKFSFAKYVFRNC